MGSVQPFLEGSFRNDRARGFGSIQSEAVIRVGRILKSREEIYPDLLSMIVDRPRRNAPQVYCAETIFRVQSRGFSVPDALRGCFRFLAEERFKRSFGSATDYVTAFAKRGCGKDTQYRDIVRTSAGCLWTSSRGEQKRMDLARGADRNSDELSSITGRPFRASLLPIVNVTYGM